MNSLDALGLIRLKQTIHSIPSYFQELRAAGTMHHRLLEIYLKFPYAFAVPNAPPVLCLEPTNDCNLNCLHCPRAIMKREVEYIDPSLFEKIVREASQIGTYRLNLYGMGEPLMHPELPGMLRMLRNTPLHTVLTTNGVLLPQYSNEDLFENGLIEIDISVDGRTPEEFESIRLGIGYREIQDRITDLYRRKRRAGRSLPRIVIRHVIMPGESHGDLLDFKRTWKPFCDSIKFNYYIPNKPPQTPSSSLRRRCRNIRKHLYVRANGLVPVCAYQYRFGDIEWLGDVREESIAALWRHPRLEELRQAHLNRDVTRLPFCAACPLTQLG
jgi:MoaA/NifB/PqqE/SkfB family radical SAM enzyme